MNARPDPQREKEILKQALDLAADEERERFIQRACGDDSALLSRVRELAGAFERVESPLAQASDGPPQEDTVRIGSPAAAASSLHAAKPPPATPSLQTSLPPATEKVGDRLGHYRLIEEIGEGGCGIVYLAEQLEPVRRRVALKIVKLGMDTKQVIARFEMERQALAVMEHPNIAKVFDAGTTNTGRPYFVMELVRGVRLTRFCDERRLCLRERLELFVQVCRAIQHAHHKGVIHRDIKPSNILVTMSDGVAVPKVIDFGIAKATAGNLTEHTLFTMFEQVLGTPAYMSPEQADVRGVDLDTRSDIYSLGVVLYELFTGRTPFDSKALLQRGIEELILTLQQVEPLRPSACLSSLPPAERERVAQVHRCAAPALISSLRGDLDWIVMKCLEKDRARRYDTADGLAMDVGRYLGNEPVVARPPSVAYRLHKAVRRHRLAFGAAALVTLALAAGIGGVILVQHRVNLEYRQRLYVYQMERAGTAVAAGRFDRLGSTLAQCPPQHRHWEWHYLKGQQDRWSLRTVFNLDRPVRRLLLSRDGSLVAVMAGEQVGTIQILQFPSGQPLSSIQMRTSMWAPLAWHPSGEWLAGVPVEDRTLVQLWKVRTGELWRSLPHEDAVACLSFSPDGRLLATGGGRSRVSCWDLSSGIADQPVFPVSNATALAFAPDGVGLAVGTREQGIQLMEVASGKCIDRFSVGQSQVRVLAFSPDGKKLVSTQVHPSLQRSRTKLWDCADGSSKDLGIADGLNAQFSPDGGWILGGGTTLWDGTSGEMLGRLRLADLNYGMATTFHPNGAILSAGDGGSVILAQPNRPAFERLLGHQASLRVLRFSPDGRTVASAGLECGIRLWDVATARNWQTYTGHTAGVAALAWSPDGRSVVSGSFSQELFCWEPATMRLRWAASMDDIRAGEVWWLEFSPAGNRILSSSENGVLGLWDPRTGASLGRMTVKNTTGAMDGATWSPDGKRIAGLFKDRVVLWIVDGWAEQWSVPADGDRCIRFSPDGRWLVHCNYDGSLSLRNASNGRLLRSFERNQISAKGAVFSPDGLRLFSGGADGAVRIWDSRSGDELLELHVTGDPLVWSIDLSPDGRTLAAADSDGVVTLWKTERVGPGAVQELGKGQPRDVSRVAAGRVHAKP